MRIYHDIDQIPTSRVERTLVIGNFDGLHLGHQYVIAQAKEQSPAKSVMILTFSEPPSNFFRPDEPKKLLQSVSDRLSIMEQIGVDEVCVQCFNHKFSSISAINLVSWFEQWNVTQLMMGFDQALGAKRHGNFEMMQYLCTPKGIDVTQLQQQGQVSSSHIRSALQKGDIQSANACLGRPFSLMGRVVEGNKIGRTIDFPTANLQLDPLQLLPKDGVYICNTWIANQCYLSVANIGKKPTIQQDQRTVEVHILDFDQGLYGDEITLEFTDYIREETKFGTLDALKAQIARDVQTARASI